MKQVHPKNQPSDIYESIKKPFDSLYSAKIHLKDAHQNYIAAMENESQCEKNFQKAMEDFHNKTR